MKTNMNKEALLKTLMENSAQHQEIFDEAVEGYKTRAVELLEDHINRIKKGKLERVYVSLPTPENHLRDYKRVIEMVKKHEETHIGLDESEFASYVQDDWDWKRAFLTSTSDYSPTATKQLKRYSQ